MRTELISREEMRVLTDVYMGHALHCPCPSCRRVDPSQAISDYQSTTSNKEA